MKQLTIGSTTASYAYNGDGVRMSSTVGSNTTNYVWDVAAGLPVILQDGTNTYVYGLGLISTYDGTDMTYRLTDGLGSTVNLCDQDGNVLVTYAYDAFGGIRSQTGSSSNPFQFTGEQRDSESGYDFLRARYYDPVVGRFLSQDPLGGGYPYGSNNPANMTDPLGLCSFYAETPGGMPVCADDPLIGTPADYGAPFTPVVAPSDVIAAVEEVQAEEGCSIVCNLGNVGGALSDVGGAVVNGAVFVANLPTTTVATGAAVIAGADCGLESGLLIVCSDAPGALYFGGGTTYGNVFITGDARIDEDLLGHELNHSRQYAGLGTGDFLSLYLLNQAVATGAVEVLGLPGDAECYNIFERHAGLDEGRYEC